MRRSQWIQLGCVLAGIGLLLWAAGQQGPADKLVDENELTNQAVEQHAELGWVTTIPGGLRAVAINYLWVKATEQKDKGRYYDAKQLADLICDLQPRSPGVWSFNAWNMAWNISVATQTPQERWQWVSNGMRLLRDKGIPMNPQSLKLYWELGWILFSKMGGTTDEMHMVYKQRWAYEMQRLLSAPPAGTTKEVIDAFRPVAEAPLDRNPRRRRVPGELQADQLAILRAADADVEKLVTELAKWDIRPGYSLLDYYNEHSRDPEPMSVRPRGKAYPVVGDDDRSQALDKLINGENWAAARSKLLAFVRAQILWRDYRMDPAWMLKLMAENNVPLDWRMVWPHGIYWVTYGYFVCRGESFENVTDNNARRIIMNCFKELTWNGVMAYEANPDQPEAPQISFFADPRYIEPAHEAHLQVLRLDVKKMMAEDPNLTEKEAWKRSIFRAGHMNYLISAIGMLYRSYRIDEAQKLYDWLRENYQPDGPIWKNPLVGDFVRQYMQKEGRPIPEVARAQITASLHSGYVLLAQGNTRGYRQCRDYARFIHTIFNTGTAERTKLPDFGLIERNILVALLIEPRRFGYDLSLLDRSRLYNRSNAIDVPTGPTVFRLSDMVYGYIAYPLRLEVENRNRMVRNTQQEPYNFDAMFPEPSGFARYRQWLQIQQQQRRPVQPGAGAGG